MKNVSKLGYSDGSPYRNRKKIKIHTPNGTIDMSNTGIPLMANGVYLPPYSGIHQFDTDEVTKTPMQMGGKISYNPNLAATDKQFQDWYSKNTWEAKEGRPYSDKLDYDFYSFYRNGDYKNPNYNMNDHFPDTYKRPTHPTFSNESIYSVPENSGGSWKGEIFIPTTIKQNKMLKAGGTKRKGMHQMPDGTWMKNNSMQAGGRLVSQVPAGYSPVPNKPNYFYKTTQSSVNGTVQPKASNANWAAFLASPQGKQWQAQQMQTDTVYTKQPVIPQAPVKRPIKAIGEETMWRGNRIMGTIYDVPRETTNDAVSAGNQGYRDERMYQDRDEFNKPIGEPFLIKRSEVFGTDRRFIPVTGEKKLDSSRVAYRNQMAGKFQIGKNNFKPVDPIRFKEVISPEVDEESKQVLKNIPVYNPSGNLPDPNTEKLRNRLSSQIPYDTKMLGVLGANALFSAIATNKEEQYQQQWNREQMGSDEFNPSFSNTINDYGSYQKGGTKQGKPPIYVNDKNDPRLKSYNDSVSLYNKWVNNRKNLERANTIVYDNIPVEDRQEFISNFKEDYKTEAYKDWKRTGIVPDREAIGRFNGPGGAATRYEYGYKKPVQPIQYQQRIALVQPNRKPKNMIPVVPKDPSIKSYQKNNLPLLNINAGTPNLLQRNTGSVELGDIPKLPYQVDYYQDNELQTKGFMNSSEGEEFMKELNPVTGLPEYKNRGDYRVSGYKKLQEGGEIDNTDEDDFDEYDFLYGEEETAPIVNSEETAPVAEETDNSEEENNALAMQYATEQFNLEDSDGNMQIGNQGDNVDESYTASNISPNESIKAVKDYYISKGYNQEFVAGVLGNIHAESGGKSDINEINPTSGRGGFGLFQHTGPRRKALFSFARQNGLNPIDPITQAMFAEQEPDFKVAYNAAKGKSAGEAAKIFEQKFERAGIKNYAGRVGAANAFYKSFKLGGTYDINESELHDLVKRGIKFKLVQ